MLDIQIINDSTFAADDEAIRDLVSHTCRKHSITDADISIAITDDKGISLVHSEFMNDDSITDVISFNLSEPDEQAKTFEVIVNADLAVRCAAERGIKAQAELMLYILHGLLHNIGFDDLTAEDFNIMHTAENEILEELGYGKVFGKIEFEGK